MSDTKIQQHRVHLNRLEILVVVVAKKKLDYYEDLLSAFEVNFIMKVLAKGSMNQKADLFGVDNEDKGVIFAIIKGENAKRAIETLEDKFKTIKNGNGIAFTIPMESIIGAKTFSFLANNEEMIVEEPDDK